MSSEVEYQCGRCGSSITFQECGNCGGDGVTGHDCGEDCCCCADPEDNVTCDICHGVGAFPHDTMELLLSLGIPLSPNCLSVAITKDNLIIFRYLLDKGAIMSNSANKEILLCCGKGSIKILEFLLDEDREVQLIPRNFDRYLHEAMAGTKNKETIRLLISKGADKNIIPKHKRKELLEKKCGHPTGIGQPCQRKTCNTYCFQHTK